MLVNLEESVVLNFLGMTNMELKNYARAEYNLLESIEIIRKLKGKNSSE